MKDKVEETVEVLIVALAITQLVSTYGVATFKAACDYIGDQLREADAKEDTSCQPSD